MATHPLFTHELSLARQDDLRRAAGAVRSTKISDGDLPAKIRWIRRFVTVEETRCCAPECTSW
jgi:hypothetical protein